MSSHDFRIQQAAAAVYGAWLDDTEDGPGLRALTRAWARHFGVDPGEVWYALDGYLD